MGDEDRERRGEGDEGREGDEGDEDRERRGEGDEGRAGDEGDEGRERRGEGDEGGESDEGDEDREPRREGDEGGAGDEGDEDRERRGEGDEGGAGDEGDEDRERRGDGDEGDEEVSCWGRMTDVCASSGVRLSPHSRRAWVAESIDLFRNRCVCQLRRVVVSARSSSVGRREHRHLPQGMDLLYADSALFAHRKK